MTRTVKDYSAVLVRVLVAIGGFRAKHKYWPSRVELGEASIGSLVTKHMTAQGMANLMEKVELAAGYEGDVLASGRGSDSFSYGNESANADLGQTCDWLGIELPQE